MKALGESVPGYKIRDMVKEVDLDENGTIEFEEFLSVHYNYIHININNNNVNVSFANCSIIISWYYISLTV